MCLTLAQMGLFLTLIDIPFTHSDNSLTIHARTGDVVWVLENETYCTDKGNNDA